VLGPRFERALVYGFELPRTQVRKGTALPDGSDLLAVASLELGGDEATVIAVRLPDAVEKGGGATTRTRIETKFGARVADHRRGGERMCGRFTASRQQPLRFIAHSTRRTGDTDRGRAGRGSRSPRTLSTGRILAK